MDDIGTKTIDALTREYYAQIRAIATEIALAVENNPDEDFSDAVHEACGDHACVIYTYKAKLVRVLSSNADAADDIDETQRYTPEQYAYYAMCADVQDLLKNPYFQADIRASKADTARCIAFT